MLDIDQAFTVMPGEVADALPALIAYVDAGQRYRFVNKAYEDWFGESLEALRGRTVEDVLGYEAFQAVRPHLEAALLGERRTFEAVVPYKTLGPRNVEARYVPDLAETGEVRGFFALIVDRTGDHAIARQLEAILDGFGDGFIAFDWDWKVSHCNAAAAAHFGVQAPDLVGRVIWDVFPQTVGSPIETALRRVMSSRAPLETEVQSRVRDALVSLRVFALDAGIGVSLRDITERRAAELRLRESEARFRAMADSAPAPVWVTAASGPVEFANQALADFAGLPQAELLGDAWLELMHPDDVARVVATRREARKGPDPYTFEARFRRRDGQWRWLRATAKPRLDDDGTFQGYVGMAIDVTDQHLAEARQRLLINELNHRVKNTLATVQSLAHQTVKDGVPVREARERLTARLLALSAAHNVLTRENWEGAELTEVAAEAVRPYDDAMAPRILLDGPAARVAPNVALAVSMGLHELATNATKYGALSLPGGRVTVRWTLEGEAVLLEWREAGGPPVAPQPARGFGSRLLSQGLAAELGAPATLDWRPSGLVCRFRAPVAR